MYRCSPINVTGNLRNLPNGIINKVKDAKNANWSTLQKSGQTPRVPNVGIVN